MIDGNYEAKLGETVLAEADTMSGSTCRWG